VLFFELDLKVKPDQTQQNDTPMKTTSKHPISIPEGRSSERSALDYLDTFQDQGLRLIAERALEAEVEEYLQRRRSERRTEHSAPAYRNGTTPSTLRTPTSRVTIDRPRVRSQQSGTTVDFQSEVWSRLEALESGLRRLTIELYARGLSTRDIEETLVDETGRPLVSRSTASRMTEDLYNEHEMFRSRDLSELDVVYLFCDGVYESIKRYTKNQTILCCWAILSDGTKQMIHLAAVESESERAWNTFFEEMLDRGLRQPLLVISDGAKGLHQAITRAFPIADRQRCIAHKLRNLAAKLPEEAQQEVLGRIKDIYYASDRRSAEVLAAVFIEEQTPRFPSMVQCFQDDLEACLVHLEYPLGHRRFIRTTNLLERCFEEQKRRTKVLPQHEHEKAALKLVFAVLLRASKKWTKVKMTPLEIAQLRNLRLLKLKAEDTEQRTENQSNKNYISIRRAA
jgi:putative transposase